MNDTYFHIVTCLIADKYQQSAYYFNYTIKHTCIASFFMKYIKKA